MSLDQESASEQISILKGPEPERLNSLTFEHESRMDAVATDLVMSDTWRTKHHQMILLRAVKPREVQSSDANYWIADMLFGLTIVTFFRDNFRKLWRNSWGKC